MQVEPLSMEVPAGASIETLEGIVRREGFAAVPGIAMAAALEQRGPLTDWTAFAASWNDLGLDTYMADGGRYRRRRYGVYAVDPAGDVSREPHQPHYQSRSYNSLNGGIERWFEPILPAIGGGPSMTAVLDVTRRLFSALAPATPRWHVEVHQFRIEAKPDAPGRPTPEGSHRDGVDYVLVLLIKRQNVKSGTTTIHDAKGLLLGSFTLTDAFDAALVDDHRCYHGVTPVEPLDAAQPAYRDVLVVTYRAA